VIIFKIVQEHLIYRLPEEVVQAGKLTRIGFIHLDRATYGNVRLRVCLASR
jgi:hypothetical protein